jgi:Phage integrase, N-terminal SAM-like domain
MNEEPFAGAPDRRHFRPRFLPGRPGVEKVGFPAQNRLLHAGGKGARAPRMRKPKRLDQVREAIRMRHDSVRTEEAYVGWIKRFIFFHGKRHSPEMEDGTMQQGDVSTYVLTLAPGMRPPAPFMAA